MWLDDSTQGDLIQMDTLTVKTGAYAIANQVVRGADAMGIHFNLDTANPAACICDLWDSSIPGFTEEAGALGQAVINAFHAYLSVTLDAVTRAVQLEADQAQIAASSGLSGTSANADFGVLLAQAIVNDGNNRAIGTWLGSTPGTSQVEILLAMQGQGGGGGGNIDVALNQIAIDAENNANKVWLAPTGMSYAGENESGQDTYTNRMGETKTNSEIQRDDYDENNNGDDDDYI